MLPSPKPRLTCVLTICQVMTRHRHQSASKSTTTVPIVRATKSGSISRRQRGTSSSIDHECTYTTLGEVSIASFGSPPCALGSGLLLVVSRYLPAVRQHKTNRIGEGILTSYLCGIGRCDNPFTASPRSRDGWLMCPTGICE